MNFKCFFLGLIAFVLAACGGKTKGSGSVAGSPPPEANEVEAEKIAKIETVVQRIEVFKPEVTELKSSFQENRSLFSTDIDVTDNDIEVNYAELEMVTAGNLWSNLENYFGLTDEIGPLEYCQDKVYSQDKPTFDDIIPLINAGVCGELSFRICLKFTIKSLKKDTYKFSPLVSISIPCAESTLSNFALAINNGAISTTNTSVDLSLDYGADIKEVSLFNNQTCQGDENWVIPTASVPGWPLESPFNTQKYVSAYARDYLKRKTSCISASILHDSIPPAVLLQGSLTSIPPVTQNTLTLNFEDPSAISEVSHQWGPANLGSEGCSTGFQPLQSASTITVPTSDGTHTLYVRAKDIAGNTSECESFSVTVDRQPPTPGGQGANGTLADFSAPHGGILSIVEGNLTRQSSVTLNLSAVGAAEMSVTQNTQCSGNPSWETFSNSKSWVLGNLNGSNTVFVKLRDAFGNETNCVSATIVHDSTPPTANGSLVINGGASHTNQLAVTLTPSATGAVDMYVTNTSGCPSGGSWEAYSTSKAWDLAALNSLQSVYVKYRDQAGNETACLAGTITTDSTVPTGTITINNGDNFTTSVSTVLNLTSSDAEEVYITATSGCASGGSWAAFASPLPYTLLTTNATNTVYAKFKDLAGNESSCVSDSISHDNTAPSSVSISIDSGAATTTSTSVTLTIAATSAAEMYITSASGCASGGTWEAFSNTKSWTLTSSDGSKTVYLVTRDAAGNLSSCESDAITLNTPPAGPTNPTVSFDAGVTTYQTLNALTIGGTDATEMYITSIAGCGSGGSWEAFANTKNWTLSSSVGAQSVYMKLRGNSVESACVSDSVVVSAPSIDSVNDDTKTLALHALRFSWTPAAVSSSVITSYQVALGSTSGGSDLVAWGSAGTATTFLFTNLELTEGATYYASVRAISPIGTGNAASGDGVVAGRKIQISGGRRHQCVLADNQVKCFGVGTGGATGYEANTNVCSSSSTLGSNLPYLNFGTGRTVKQLTSAYQSNCVILDNDRVKCWGSGSLGMLGSGSTSNAGNQANTMGNNLAAIDLGTGQTPAKLMEPAPNSEHICVILTNGRTKCWGKNNSGNMGVTGLAADEVIGDGSAEMGDSLAFTEWGTESSDPLQVAQLVASKLTNCARFTNGKVKCLGDNTNGAQGIGSTTSGGLGDSLSFVDFGTSITPMSLAATTNIDGGTTLSTHCMIDSDAELRCFGGISEWNSRGLLGRGANGHNSNANTWGFWGDVAGELGNNFTPIQFAASSHVYKVVMTTGTGCALMKNNSVKCWGAPYNGQRGVVATDGIGATTGDMASLPDVDLAGTSGKWILDIAAGANHFCAIFDDLKVKCWGTNYEDEICQGYLGVLSNDHVGDESGEMGDNLPFINLGL